MGNTVGKKKPKNKETKKIIFANESTSKCECLALLGNFCTVFYLSVTFTLFLVKITEPRRQLVVERNVKVLFIEGRRESFHTFTLMSPLLWLCHG